jgi:hypothetical protein
MLLTSREQRIPEPVTLLAPCVAVGRPHVCGSMNAHQLQWWRSNQYFLAKIRQGVAGDIALLE